MSLHTAVIFNNDNAACVLRPEFARALYDTLAAGVDDNSGLRTHHLMPLRQISGASIPTYHHHSDTVMLLVTGGQARKVLHMPKSIKLDDKGDQEYLLRKWAQSLGLKVIRQPKTKRQRRAAKSV